MTAPLGVVVTNQVIEAKSRSTSIEGCMVASLSGYTRNLSGQPDEHSDLLRPADLHLVVAR